MNFHRAAKRLNISQPPLSLTIQQLEDEIGTKLFDRVGRHIEITKSGESFLLYAQKTLIDAENAKRKALLIGEGKRGVIKIGFISSSITGILQDVILNFKNTYPDIEIEMSQSVNGWLGQKILNQEYDMAFIRWPEYLPNGIKMRPLTKDHWSIVCQKKDKISKLKSVSIERLINENLIFYPRYNNPAGYDEVMNLFHSKNLHPNIVQEAPEQMTIAALVSSGMGIGIVPGCMSQIPFKSLTHIPIKGTKNKTGFAIIYPENPDILTKKFLDHLPDNQN